MPKFIVLGKVSKEGLQSMLAEDADRDLPEKIAADVGIKIDESFLTLGEFDFVGIVTAPALRHAIAFAVAFGAAAGVTTTTLAAENSIGDIVDSAASSYQTRHQTRHEARP
jgi:uncharacterized protein with GYD domain